MPAGRKLDVMRAACVSGSVRRLGRLPARIRGCAPGTSRTGGGELSGSWVMSDRIRICQVSRVDAVESLGELMVLQFFGETL